MTPNIVTLIRRHECHGNVLLYVQPPEAEKLIDEIERLKAAGDGPSSQRPAPNSQLPAPSDLERAEQLFAFLRGWIPSGFRIADDDIPRLTAAQAWTVIWYLGEAHWQVPDTIERCDLCGELFDSRSEGECFDCGLPPYHACDSCRDTREAKQKRRLCRRLEAARERQRAKKRQQKRLTTGGR